MIGALRGLAMAACVLAAVWLSVEVVRYDGARTAWAVERDRFATETYDAARSDATYAEVEARRAAARTSAWCLAGAVLVLASLAGGSAKPARSASPGRLLAASAIDVASSAVLVALAAWLAALPASLALADALARVLPALALAVPLATLAAGATPGMRAVGLRIEGPPPLRAALATALLPLTAAWLALALVPLATLVALGRPPGAAWLAPHLALTGTCPPAPGRV